VSHLFQLPPFPPPRRNPSPPHMRIAGPSSLQIHTQASSSVSCLPRVLRSSPRPPLYLLPVILSFPTMLRQLPPPYPECRSLSASFVWRRSSAYLPKSEEVIFLCTTPVPPPLPSPLGSRRLYTSEGDLSLTNMGHPFLLIMDLSLCVGECVLELCWVLFAFTCCSALLSAVYNYPNEC